MEGFTSLSEASEAESAAADSEVAGLEDMISEASEPVWSGHYRGNCWPEAWVVANGRERKRETRWCYPCARMIELVRGAVDLTWTLSHRPCVFVLNFV